MQGKPAITGRLLNGGSRANRRERGRGNTVKSESMASKKFNRLEKKIEKEYEKEGYSKKKSEYIGRATAGKVAREKRKKRYK